MLQAHLENGAWVFQGRKEIRYIRVLILFLDTIANVWDIIIIPTIYGPIGILLYLRKIWIWVMEAMRQNLYMTRPYSLWKTIKRNHFFYTYPPLFLMRNWLRPKIIWKSTGENILLKKCIRESMRDRNLI